VAVALALASSGFLLTAVFIVVTMSLAGFARVWIQRATFGMGPRLFSFRVGSAPIEVRALPFGSSVTPFGANPYAEDDALSKPPAHRLPWLEAPPWRRAVAFVVAPRLCELAITSLALGPARALRAIAIGPLEIVHGALGPFSHARDLLQAGADAMSREGFAVLTALVLCKMMIFGIVSLPIDLAHAVARRPAKSLAIARAVLMLSSFVIYAAWAVAFIAWLVTSR
jgi:hypothetical protein